MRDVVWSIAAGLTGVALCGVSPARAGATPSSADPVVVAIAQAPVPGTYERGHAAPPVLMAQSLVPVTPVVAVQPAPALAASAAVVPGRSFARAVTPNGSQPGVIWVIAIGALLCRIGARVLRVS